MKQIRAAFSERTLLLDVSATDPADIFHQAMHVVIAQGQLPSEHRQEVEAALLAREQLASTAIGHSVAIPHAYLDVFERPVVVFVRLAHPLNLGAPDGIATRFVFILLGSTADAAAHIDTLMHVARLMSDDQFRFDAGQANSSEEMLVAFDNYVRRTSVPPEARKPAVSPGLQYTGRLFGGLWGDVRRRLPHYLRDFSDGLHIKSASSITLLFFACLAPAVTFGGVMAVETGNQIGAVEMILASAFCGVVYALFSGQPLVILGGTGPLLIFTGILYRLCGDLGIPFLPTYAWVGLWTMLCMFLLSVTDASCLMRYFTRFTDEIFAGLISLIFVYEAVKALVYIFRDLEVKQHHDTALLSLLLALGTFYLAHSLSRFHRSRYLRPKIREFLADFGPGIALTCMTLVALWLHGVYLDTLPAPEHLGTTAERAWRVDLMAVPMWVRIAALGPALLATVLLFLDQNITARIVNNPGHRLHKGEAYHLDLAVVGALVGACSLFGLPWLVAATVRSINHVRSLATVEEIDNAHGDTRERVIHVRENRITPLVIHVLIGLSLFLLPWLKLIPMAVLYGLFLFMGVVSLKGNQFFERLTLWFMDSDLYPSTHYIRRVPVKVVHQFTLLQLAGLVVLWTVKVSSLAILFPLFIAAGVPIRFLAGRLFAPEHLAALDAEEEPDEEETHYAA
jgi:mannitol/fructose-specific phosphotransferase system IIA component (Ntr-type)